MGLFGALPTDKPHAFLTVGAAVVSFAIPAYANRWLLHLELTSVNCDFAQKEILTRMSELDRAAQRLEQQARVGSLSRAKLERRLAGLQESLRTIEKDDATTRLERANLGVCIRHFASNLRSLIPLHFVSMLLAVVGFVLWSRHDASVQEPRGADCKI